MTTPVPRTMEELVEMIKAGLARDRKSLRKTETQLKKAMLRHPQDRKAISSPRWLRGMIQKSIRDYEKALKKAGEK